MVSSPQRVEQEAIEQLATQVRGRIIQPEDDGYDAARSVWNAMIDKRPAAIVQCSGTADVVAAVNFARNNSVTLAVRGGGHNVAGNAVCDDGIVVDLSQMKGIHVDSAGRIARVQPGADWGDLDHETQLHGMMTPGGVVSSTGVAGFTLAGGLSATRRKWGMACDNLESVEIVTAAGEVVNASENSHPDLFWAIRGGGGNFGIVTSFQFKLHSLGPECALTAPFYRLEDAPGILRAWREFIENAPDEISSDVIFWSMPPLPGVAPEVVGSPIVIITGFYAGPAAHGAEIMQPIREFGTPIADLSHIGRYVDIQQSFDPFFPDTQRYYWKSLFINSLGDDIIDGAIDLAASKPSPQTLMVIRALGGAISRVPESASAYGNREARYNLSLDTTWVDPADDERMIEWTRNAWDRVSTLSGDVGVYLNFAGLGEDSAQLAQGAYGTNMERLREVKRQYDPENLFKGNVNIAPR